MRFASRKTGWIGVDIGTSTVKIAQLVRSPSGLRVAAKMIVPRQENWPEDLAGSDQTLSSLNEISAACSLEDRFRGRRAAGMLSMALCDVHLVDRSLEQEANAEQVIRQTIETATQQSAEGVQFDHWSAPASDGKPGWTQALAVARSWTDRLVEDVAQAGWSCAAIDGLPLALTRAVHLVHPKASEGPVAALDWGHHRATLCLIDQGQPAYVRCLKDCGLRNVLDALTSNLQVTDVEAQKLLEDYGLAASSTENPSEIAQLVQEIVAEPLSRLLEEMRRSLSHFQYLRRSSIPKHLYLFGGGATINQLDVWLSDRLDLESHVWQLPGQTTNQASANSHADCLFAPAIALSALAWEES